MTTDVKDQFDRKKPLVNSIFDFSAEALGEVMAYIAQNPPSIPISQIIGFSQMIPQKASVAATETTTSGTYTNLATTGPEITGLSGGKYLVIVSAGMKNDTAGKAAIMAPSFNGSTPLDADAAYVFGANIQGSYFGVAVALLSSDNNKITAKYRVDTVSTGTFFLRNLVAIRMSNI